MAAILDTAKSLAVVGLWVCLGGIRPTSNKLGPLGWLLIYDCCIGYCSGIIRILTVRLRKYTQSMAALLYTAETLAVLDPWVWLGGIRPTRSKLDPLG